MQMIVNMQLFVNMKKYIVAVCMMVLAVVSANAQTSVVNNPNNKAYFGLRIGADITCPGNISSQGIGLDIFNTGGGVEFGGIYNIPLVANLYIEPGLKLYYDSYSMNDKFVEAMTDDPRISMSFNKFGMRIPVMIGYHFDVTDNVKLSLFTGPEFEIGFTANMKATGYGKSMSESLYSDDGGMRRGNIIWGIGAGMSIRHFYFGINGGIGMLNMISDSDGESFHENRVTISVGYNF